MKTLKALKETARCVYRASLEYRNEQSSFTNTDMDKRKQYSKQCPRGKTIQYNNFITLPKGYSELIYIVQMVKIGISKKKFKFIELFFWKKHLLVGMSSMLWMGQWMSE